MEESINSLLLIKNRKRVCRRKIRRSWLGRKIRQHRGTSGSDTTSEHSQDNAAVIAETEAGMSGTQTLTGRLIINTLSEEKVEEKPKALVAFTCFKDLPSELRCKIWKMAAFVPRDVSVWSSNFGENIGIPLRAGEDDETHLMIWKLKSPTPPPPMLGATVESRTEGLRYYKLSFGTDHVFRDFAFSTRPSVYVNFDADRICFLESFMYETSRACKEFFERCLTNGTRFFAVNIRSYESAGIECSYIRPFIKKRMAEITSSKLEEITLVSTGYERSMEGELDFREWEQQTAHPDTLVKGARKWLVESGLVKNAEMENEVGVKFHFKELYMGDKRI